MTLNTSFATQKSPLLGCAPVSRAVSRPFARCQAESRADRSILPAGNSSSRRQTLGLGGGAALVLLQGVVSPQAFAAKPPSGYTPIKDAQDGYAFVSPFGWQEVSVKGQDVVYKDVIEPLESVSVSLTTTDKKDITEYGSPIEIAATLSRNVLTPRNQDVKVLGVNERESEGRKYVEFEFASKAPNYIRHALASVTIANGKFYTLTTGANEFRWEKMKDRLKTVLASFEVSDRFPTS